MTEAARLLPGKRPSPVSLFPLGLLKYPCPLKNQACTFLVLYGCNLTPHFFISVNVVLTGEVIKKQGKIFGGESQLLKPFRKRVVSWPGVRPAPACAQAASATQKQGPCSCTTKHLMRETALRAFNRRRHVQSFSTSGVIDHREGSGGWACAERGSQMFDSASFLPNRSAHTSIFCVGRSWVNLVNDISFSQEPGLARTQFKADRHAPSAWGGEVS